MAKKRRKKKDTWQNARERIQEGLRGGSTRLDLRTLGLTSLPESIGQLAYLQSLDLTVNELTSLPESIGHLAHLESLDLSFNRLTWLPKSIGQLACLRMLLLRKNQLTLLPESIGQLARLQSLGLSSNNLTLLPESIGQLRNLQTLRVSENQLRSLPESIGHLANLQSLDLKLNRLTSLPQSIGQLRNLESLDLLSNRLTSLPESIGQLRNLESLDLRSNQLTSLPESIGQLANLRSLDLSSNNLTSLPESIRRLTGLRSLFLHGNEALGLAPEVLGPAWLEVGQENVAPAEPAKIHDYYFRLRPGKRPIHEAKLLLVGFGAVGKTSLVKRLVRGLFHAGEPKTDGIEVTRWPLLLPGGENVQLNVWDFGGQEIMHSTHQFFLTERSLYLVVLNGRQGHEDSDAEYWLNLVQSFGGDSPVIVVVNKVKEQPFDLNRRGLKAKYPAVRAFVETDCAGPTPKDPRGPMGIEELHQAILRETDRLEHLRDAFPAAWFAIKERLSGMAEDYLTFEQYREICRNLGEREPEAQDSLAGHLHNLGIALNYKDDPRLRDMHVLNPRWVTEGIYKIINAPLLAERKGELRLKDVGGMLDPNRYPRERHLFLLELMGKFELCLPFSDRPGEYLVPDLLGKEQAPEADDFRPAQCLNFQYQYPVRPEGFLPRFLVRTYKLSEGQARWRTGVILQYEGSRALVKAELLEKRIAVSVSGPGAQRGRLLAVIRSNFDHIHAGLAFRPEELVPLPGHPQAVVPYQELLTWERAGRTEVERVFGDEVFTLDVPKLLGTVDFGRPRSRRGGLRHGLHPEDRPAEEAVDVGILMALKEEFAEFFPQIEGRCRTEQDPMTGAYFYHFEQPVPAGRPYQCVATFVGAMGELKAGLLTERLLHQQGPETLVWLGIGAGIDKDVKVGDVVAATEVESYAQDAKAVEAEGPLKFAFQDAGQAYRPNEDLVNEVRNFRFAHAEAFADWQRSAWQKLQSEVPEDALQALLDERLVGQRPAIHEGPMASGPFVGATTDFCAWVKTKNRKFLVLEMESGGFLAAVSAATLPAHSLVLRGVSDYGDERKAQLDRIGHGVLRRWAMANAVGLLWKLLEAGVLPRAT